MYLIINTAEHPFLYAGKSFMHNSLEFLILISKKHFFASLIYFGKKKNQTREVNCMMMETREFRMGSAEGTAVI